jgi:hypothetical protein
MAVTTRYGNARPIPKSFSWSYSKLKNYETCPKRHYHYDVAKDVKEPESTELKAGNHVHKILELRIRDGVPFSDSYAYLEPWAQRVLNGTGQVLVEQQFAITKDFEPCAWFDSENPPDKRAWYRAKGDVVKLNRSAALVIDWKTGKILEDSVQLMLTAACLFYHYPQLRIVRSMYVWLKEDADTVEEVRREDLPRFWNNIWDRIEALRTAADTVSYPPTPNRLCRNWCHVKQCPHYGTSHGG